jgi:hypothetical protein
LKYYLNHWRRKPLVITRLSQENTKRSETTETTETTEASTSGDATVEYDCLSVDVSRDMLEDAEDAIGPSDFVDFGTLGDNMINETNTDSDPSLARAGEYMLTHYQMWYNSLWPSSNDAHKVQEPPLSLFDEFIEIAKDKWHAGTLEYRGGDESIPFNGDPLEEIEFEAADIYAYSKEAFKQELLTPFEHDELNVLAFEVYKLIRRAQSREGEDDGEG